MPFPFSSCPPSCSLSSSLKTVYSPLVLFLAIKVVVLVVAAVVSRCRIGVFRFYPSQANWEFPYTTSLRRENGASQSFDRRSFPCCCAVLYDWIVFPHVHPSVVLVLVVFCSRLLIKSFDYSLVFIDFHFRQFFISFLV